MSDPTFKQTVERDYEVGRGKPPVATRFKKGSSGNPRGRPKGVLNLTTSLQKALGELVVINEGGRRKAITKLEAGTKQFSNRVASGDQRAMQQLLTIAPMVGLTSEATPGVAERSVADQNVLAQMVLRMQQSVAPSVTTAAHSPESEPRGTSHER